MPGVRTSIPKPIAALLAITAAFSATPDYFPLEAGNSWVYRSEGNGGPQAGTIEVIRTEVVADKQYFLTRFLGREVLLRMTDEGSLAGYDQTARIEKLWVPLHASPNTSFDTAIDDCTQAGRIKSRTAEYKGPVGESNQAVAVLYEPKCADAGAVSATFVPQIGLVEYVTASIAGPVTYRLVYARTGVTVRADRELGFGVSIDSPTYTQPALIAVRLTLRNTLAESLRLTFPSGQNHEVAIRNEAGEEVYRWSNGKAFAAVFRTIEFGPGERNWLVEIPLEGLKPGRYFVEGSLATTPRNYVATTTVDIRAGN